MDRQLPVWASVLLVAVVSAALLVSTHLVTQVFAPPEGSVGKDSAQGEALPAAELFVPVEVPAESALDNCYKGEAGGQTVGYAAQITVKGYGGPIELVVGMDTKGLLTGISVDGAQFNESPGLGAKSKEPEFKNQFVGIATPVGLQKGDATSSATESNWSATTAPGADGTSSATQTATAAPAADATSSATQTATAAPAADATSSATQTATAAPAVTSAPSAEPAASTIDAISGATITSTAVVNGVNQCAEFIKSLLAGGNA